MCCLFPFSLTLCSYIVNYVILKISLCYYPFSWPIFRLHRVFLTLVGLYSLLWFSLFFLYMGGIPSIPFWIKFDLLIRKKLNLSLSLSSPFIKFREVFLLENCKSYNFKYKTRNRSYLIIEFYATKIRRIPILTSTLVFWSSLKPP